MPAVAFGRYQLLERLAVGGMAELFLARAQGDGGFSKTCVVKRVLPHLAADAGFVSMFLDEARLAARLDHPGIAQIFDLGKVGTDYYLAMEYLAGEDAAAILAKLEDRQRQLPVPLAVQIVALAADALHFAHEHRGDDGRPLQVVHRDVSPGNLFVTYRGQVKVLDFGIAHGAGRLGRTEPGQVKGKTAYMSPEQSLAQPVDRRTDVWALGVCLYELLTARRLFTGRTAVETAMQVVQDPIPSLRAARPEVPEALEQVVMRALERDVQQRWPTAQAFAEALRPFLPGPADRTLADELRSLFGESRAQLQLGKASALPQSRGPGTEALGKATRVVDPTEALRSREPAPATDPSGVAQGRTSRRGLVLGAGLATGAALLAVALWLWPAAPLPPPPTVPAPAVAPPPTPAPVARIDPEPAPDPAPVKAEPEREPDLDPAVVAPVRPGKPGPRPAHAPPKPLDRTPGTLTLSASVPARVSVDGSPPTPAPLEAVELAPGVHRVVLTNPGLGLSRALEVTIRPGKLLTQAVAVGTGELNVNVTPWAEVWIDGHKAGVTPLAARPIAEGAHRVRLVNPSGEKTVSIAVAPGQSVSLQERLP